MKNKSIGAPRVVGVAAGSVMKWYIIDVQIASEKIIIAQIRHMADFDQVFSRPDTDINRFRGEGLTAIRCS